MLSRCIVPPRPIRPPSKSKTISGVNPPPSSYSTTFAAAQDPIVEDGYWINGGNTGVDWENVKTVSGRSCATAFATGVDDSVCIRAGGINTTKHFVEGTVGVTGGYNPTNGHEVEQVGMAKITANSCSLYEVLFSLSGSFQIVRWNGPYNDLYFGLSVTNHNGGPAQPSNGMVCRSEFEYTGGVVNISVYQNGTLVATTTDASPPTLLQSGQPGISHFVQPGTGANLTSMGWEDFSCGTF